MSRYQIILADPPWKFNSRSRHNKGARFGLGAHGDYSGMSIQEMCDIPIYLVAEKSAVLFMWVTATHNESAFQVIRAWGFEPKTWGIVWVKTNRVSGTPAFGTGYYGKQCTEIAILATRGKIIPPATDDLSSLTMQPRPLKPGTTKIWHSRKPESQYEMIESWYPTQSKLELFARPPFRPGWDCMGNEVDGLDIRDAVRKSAGLQSAQPIPPDTVKKRRGRILDGTANQSYGLFD